MSRPWLARCLLLALGYLLMGHLGLLFPQQAGGVSSLWPAAGLALAALVRWGPTHWPGVFIGSLLISATTLQSPGVALALSATNTLAPLLAGYWLAGQGFNTGFERRRDAVLFLIAAAGGGTVAAGSAALWFSVSNVLARSELHALLLTWWMGDTLGFLAAGVPLIAWSRFSLRRLTEPRQASRNLPLLAGALLAGTSAFVWPAPAPSWLQPLAFLPHVLLCWLVLRAGIAAPSAAALVISCIAAYATSHGWGLFAVGHALQPMALVSGYVGSLFALCLLVSAIAGELVQVNNRWQLALERGQLGVAEWDLRGGATFTSAGWRALLDDADGQHTATPTGWLARMHDDDRPQVREALEKLSDPAQAGLRMDVRFLTASGWRWFDSQASVSQRDLRGRPARLVASVADISERRASEERQRLSAGLFQHLHEGLLITDAELRVLDANPTYSQITGLSRQELLGTVPRLLSDPTGDRALKMQQAAMWASLRATGTWRGEVSEVRRNGQPCTLQVTISAVRDARAKVRNHVLVISDITEQRQQRERLERQAHFDELTRLPNRTRLSQMMADAMAASEREGYLLVVCYLDLDHFKPVNDRFGHAAGDRLLVELAQRLRGALRSNTAWSDSAARLGGDEFVLLLRAGTLDEARLAVERVLRVISQPYTLEAGADAVEVTASVGATIFPLDRSDPDTLLRHADHAMYGAKQSGRNGYLFFDPEHSRRTEERVMAIGRVQEALDQRELLLYYQPKVDMRQGMVLGMEALLRWNHPEHGIIAPGQFLPLIEHTGLSARIGDWVLEQALEQLAHWERMGLPLSVSVNVSARHLQEADFAQRLAELLARHKQPLGPRLELEVLETAALADVEYTSALLERCRKLGVRFSLDDFGTGYSTLTYLKRLPVDALKIDRSFVRSMLEDRQDLAIVEGVIGLARTFGCAVVAEGVESPAQARMLIQMGCDIGQGHGIASPMPAPDVFQWVRNYRGPFAVTAAVPMADSTSARQRQLPPAL